jgi:hypothetical protein
MAIATTAGLSRSYRDSGTVLNKHDKAWHRRNRRKCAPASPAEVRECEINKVIDHMFGASLTDDDFGRDVLYELLNQMALRGASTAEMTDLAVDLLPEIADDDSLDVMIKRIGKGRRRGADQIAHALGVDYRTRTLLDLRTVGANDVSRKWRDAIQRQKEAADKRWAREQAGAKPQSRSAARNRPWEAMGICRATFYRRKKAAEKSATGNSKKDPCDCFGDHTLSVFPMDKSVSGERRHRAGGHVPAHAPASRQALARQTPVSFDQEREDVVPEVPASYAADISERVRRALAVCERAFVDQFGQSLAISNPPTENERQIPQQIQQNRRGRA